MCPPVAAFGCSVTPSAAYGQGQTRDPWVRPCTFGGKSTHHWAVDRRTRADRLADQLDPEYHRGAGVDRRAGAPCAGTERVPQSGAPRYPGEARGAARLRLIAGLRWSDGQWNVWSCE